MTKRYCKFLKQIVTVTQEEVHVRGLTADFVPEFFGDILL